jgi:hypothetical protein
VKFIQKIVDRILNTEPAEHYCRLDRLPCRPCKHSGWYEDGGFYCEKHGRWYYDRRKTCEDFE